MGGLLNIPLLFRWRWLFIMCGVITVPGSIWGFFAVPDSPYDTRAFYLNQEETALAKSRMVKLGRKPFKGVNLKTLFNVLRQPFSWIFVAGYM